MPKNRFSSHDDFIPSLCSVLGSQFRRYWRQHRPLRFLPLAFLACILLFVFRLLHIQYSTYGLPLIGLPQNNSPARLHLLIPVTTPTILFCKSWASAIIANYPPPVLINYGEQFAKPKLSHGAKLSGAAEFLRNPPAPIGHWASGDLVLFADGFDVWYQLPPDVMIRRYLSHFLQSTPVNASAPQSPDPVVFGADKFCWPNKADSLPCQLAPQSPLPPDAWGPEPTGKKDPNKRLPPRFLNSGTVLGSWRGMREIYERAARKAHDTVKGGGEVLSDQGVLAEVWGEDLSRQRSNAAAKADDGAVAHADEEGLGIVMDYESKLFMTMTHSHDDLTWGLVNTTTTTTSPGSDSDPDSGDLASALFPISPLPGQLHLATNIITSHIPALLHFNGPKFPLGDETKPGWFGRMWWFHLLPEKKEKRETGEYAKALFERARSGEAGLKGARGTAGAWTDKGEWLEWKDVCGEWDFVGKGGVWDI